MGGFIVGIDGGRGPVAMGALTRPWGGTVLVDGGNDLQSGGHHSGRRAVPGRETAT
jgi:hypothetical protein